jgi:hypothetical protein
MQLTNNSRLRDLVPIGFLATKSKAPLVLRVALHSSGVEIGDAKAWFEKLSIIIEVMRARSMLTAGT